jgi:hypothetical protein
MAVRGFLFLGNVRCNGRNYCGLVICPTHHSSGTAQKRAAPHFYVRIFRQQLMHQGLYI